MGQEVDARTDIFAVGIILWELLAGQRLFLGDTDFQTVKKVQAAAGAQHLADQQEGAAGAREDEEPKSPIPRVKNSLFLVVQLVFSFLSKPDFADCSRDRASSSIRKSQEALWLRTVILLFGFSKTDPLPGSRSAPTLGRKWPASAACHDASRFKTSSRSRPPRTSARGSGAVAASLCLTRHARHFPNLEF